MAGTIAVTLKIGRDKKKAFYDFCREQVPMVNKFFEKASENEIERRLLKESSGIFSNYGKRKKGAVDFDKVLKEINSLSLELRLLRRVKQKRSPQ